LFLKMRWRGVWGAAYEGDLDMLKQYDGDWEALDDCLWGTPLMWAISTCHLECISYILSVGANPNTRAAHYSLTTPLHLAIEMRHDSIVPLLLHHGADPESKNKDGRTPLYVATLPGFWSPRIARLLLCYGASAKSASKHGFEMKMFEDRRNAHYKTFILLGIARFRTPDTRDVIRVIASWVAINF
jgi:ankyrin repeat protein